MAKVLSDRTARDLRELIRKDGDDAPGEGPARFAGGPRPAVVRCGVLEGSSPRPYYRGMVRSIKDLPDADQFDAGTEYVFLAPLDPAVTLTGDKDYHAIRAGAHSGRPLYWTGGAGSAADTWIDAIISGGTDSGGYSWSEAELASGVWGVKSGGLSGATNLFRMPSNIDPEDIPSGQYVRIWPSPSYSGKYECSAPGGMQEVSVTLPYSWQINSGTPCTVTVATTKVLTVTGRDLTATFA